MPDKIQDALEKADGKRAKVKSLDEEPTGTKAKPLPKEVKDALEEKFGANLSRVKVHVGGNAPDLAKGLNAKAFTIGNDIFFMKPMDSTKPELLAHELAHVLQQGKGKMPPVTKGKALTSK